jgi:serine/threonine-protein kinase PknK
MADDNPVDLGIDGLQQAQEIGVGGFATVYRAYQPAFRRTVAVKVLATPNLDRASRERFERECQAMGTLADHPHIVTILDSGYTRKGRAYLVMAYLPGGSLQDRVDRHGPISWQEATLHALHLAGALETAHRAGIVHRDIKPGNVLLSAYGEAQLTDFGIARISGGHETRSGLITASMAHAPPEVLDGHRPTVAADVYALASTTFELMYGRPAFASPSDESMVPMLRRILTDSPPDLRGRGVPEAVCRALERSMAKAPDQRPPTAADLGRELQGARRALGIDPGRITVPADDGRAPSLIVAPAYGPSAPVSPGPGPGPGSGPGPLAPALPHPNVVSPLRPSVTATGQAAGRPDAGRPAAATTVAAPGDRRPRPSPRPVGSPKPRPPFDARSAPSPQRSSRAAVMGLAAVLVVLAVVGLVVVRNGLSPQGSGAVTTRSPLGEHASRSKATDYDAEVAAEFNYGCVNESFNTPGFCNCLYDAIRKEIRYDEFVRINQAIDAGEKLEETRVWPMAQSCWASHPPSPEG